MRPADPKKLTRILDAALVTVAEHGYQGSSVSRIARRAALSDGYLYRHFPGKQALFVHLYAYQLGQLYDYLENRLAEEAYLADFLRTAIRYLAQMARSQPSLFAFLFILDHQYAFPEPESVAERQRRLCHQIKARGRQTGEIGTEVRPERIHLMMFGLPVGQIQLRQKGLFYDHGLDAQDIDYLVSVLLMSWM